MSTRRLIVTLAVALGLCAAGCSGKEKTPKRETLTAQLRQEAEALKAQNENQDTSLGVSTTWTIESVDVQEPPAGSDSPTRGTIRFRIQAETKDNVGGSEIDEFEKQFDYVFNTTLQKWVFEYKP